MTARMDHDSNDRKYQKDDNEAGQGIRSDDPQYPQEGEIYREIERHESILSSLVERSRPEASADV